MIDLAQQAAQQRMAARSPDEARMANEGQQNAGGARKLDQDGKPYYDQAPLTEYPKMLYKRTEREQIQEHADSIGGLKDKPMVINRFNVSPFRPEGFLCETMIAHTPTEAETLSEHGWDVSPAAAYGEEEGLVAATSAKDEEIARLKALLEASVADPVDPANVPEKRGPGRPKLTPAINA